MSATIDQKSYLQKYLSGPSRDKKKKKKKVAKGKGFKIIDDDIDLSKLRPLDGDELDILDQGEDAPQIAGIVDERPEDVKKLEQFKTTSKWRVVNQDDGFSSKLQIEEIKKDVKEVEKENELVFGKMYSDSEDEQKNDSDLSPPRNKAQEKPKEKSKKHNSDSDFSPPRRKSTKSSPKRRSRKDSDTSPPRKRDTKSVSSNKKDTKNDDSDISPPRKRDRQTSPQQKRNGYNSDLSPPRRTDKRNSPPRRHKDSRHESKNSRDKQRKPSRWGNFDKEEAEAKALEAKIDRRQREPSSDPSPPRKGQKHSHNDKKHGKRSKSSDSDLSPERKQKKEQSKSGKYRQSPHSDLSPPRKSRQSSSPGRRRKSPSPNRKSRQEFRQRGSSSDLSPPRRPQKRNDSPPPSNKKMDKTLDGKMAGLQDARQLKEENAQFRRREDEVFNRMTDDVSGRNAQAVSRKVKRETSEERRKLKEKSERQKEIDEKYKKWNRGVKQVEAQEARVADYLHEAAKPLARHAGDTDLEDRLRQVERDGDPMLRYIKEKKRERGELGPERPSYKGSFPPNRFNLRPGYRWDGVDRSNGYEKKYFDTQNKKKAMEEEAYKWSTEDL